jgi:hypothetical protein
MRSETNRSNHETTRAETTQQMVIAVSTRQSRRSTEANCWRNCSGNVTGWPLDGIPFLYHACAFVLRPKQTKEVLLCGSATSIGGEGKFA